MFGEARESVNGIHDMGGMHGFGPVVRERDEPVFHADWERRMFALALAVMGSRSFNIDEYRRTIERMPPARYLAASYYERWLYALENLLIEKGVVAGAEIEVVVAALRAHPSSATTKVAAKGEASSHDHTESGPGALSEALVGERSLRRDQSFHPRFKPGDSVLARNVNPEGHTRIPRYARGHHGTIFRDWGVFVFPDTHAHGAGAKPQHCYAVEFDGRELWGGDHPAAERIYIDLWEDYLEAATTDAQSLSRGAPVHSLKSGAKGRSTKRPRKPVEKKTAPASHDT
jgi:nitrile hydratase subunit beta